MMPQSITPVEYSTRPHCTREQARELLQALQAAYRSLSFAERSLIKSVIDQTWRAQTMLEFD
jgi:hypothetical protein